MSRYCTLVGSVALVAAAVAGPTGLNFMPTTDILGHREVYVEYSATTNERNVDSMVYHCGAAEVGLWNRIEFGIDLGLDPKYHEIWNAKVRLAETKDSKGALSAGLWNCDADYVEPYAVGSYALGPSRLHLGVTHDDTTRIMAGFEMPMTQHFTVMADYMSGSKEQLWFGIGYDHPKVEGLSVGYSVGIPLNNKQGWQGMLAVGYTRKF